ncbi:putative bacteriophage protein GP26 [Roseibium sp. TrichSKD4]|uniref:VpaChn25_0724 family phage protein n=1 Tax=Roseibium sp. TrichSKD4 TaxID=744980 RepID=UPI0001E5760C|nr:hypothetical protein [Roseibium sp. TrichSKD4]EFO30947.1 putative bacteriophage protein GP26 [Roseibium sp. TrichSKD4]
MSSYKDFADQNIRLIILRALAPETDYSLNGDMVLANLERFGHFKSLDYLRAQLSWLQDEAGAVRVLEQGSTVVATLTRRGQDHVERRTVIPGIQRPSPEG